MTLSSFWFYNNMFFYCLICWFILKKNKHVFTPKTCLLSQYNWTKTFCLHIFIETILAVHFENTSNHLALYTGTQTFNPWPKFITEIRKGDTKIYTCILSFQPNARNTKLLSQTLCLLSCCPINYVTAHFIFLSVLWPPNGLEII